METTISLEGNNGSKTINFYKKGLKSIDFGDDYGIDWMQETTYYGHNGEVINYPKNIDEVEKVMFTSRFFAVELNLKDDEAEIIALNNAYSSPVNLRLYFNYEFEMRIVEIEIGVGKPLEIHDFYYFIDEYVTTTETSRSIRQTVHNNSAQTIKTIIYPYKEAPSALILTPDEDDDWSNRACGVVNVPYFKDGNWTIYQTEELEATIGRATSFNSRVVDVEEKAYVEVPPNSSVTVEITMTYAVLKTGYVTTVRMPNTDIDWIVTGTMILGQPISYEIETKLLEP
ncbi:MAG: hypothetical protein NC338_07605 [Firmicutes bacterium]|nr:hypothetical protein [Bacillota bacterium]MCM1401865.1 hypothetical protein [Bacteroides sp.]MCM1476720.1 hypothetical protein [Bacteroides sp.]